MIEKVRIAVSDKPMDLAVLMKTGVTGFNAYPLIEAHNARNSDQLRIISHQSADLALNFVGVSAVLPSFLVNMAIAYEKPDTRLGREIVFSLENEPRVVLATGKYFGEKDVALVVQGLSSADFAYIVNRKERSLKEILDQDGIDALMAIDIRRLTEIRLLIGDDRLALVSNFPKSNGWYLPHKDTKVPAIGATEPSLEMRYLDRLSSYAGFVVRNDGYAPYHTFARYRCSYEFGVVAESHDQAIS